MFRHFYLGFPGGSGVKSPPAMQETQMQLLGGEDPLEKERAIHSTILAWEIPWTEEPGQVQLPTQAGMQETPAGRKETKPSPDTEAY